MESLRYLLRNECPGTESMSLEDDIREAMVANFVEDILQCVLESQREWAATVIQRKWLEVLYRPGSRSSLLRNIEKLVLDVAMILLLFQFHEPFQRLTRPYQVVSNTSGPIFDRLGNNSRSQPIFPVYRPHNLYISRVDIPLT